MANYALVQIGTTLNVMSTAGAVTALTLPTGTTLSTNVTRRPRFAILGANTFLTNSPTRNLWIDRDRNVIPMNLQPPTAAPVLTAVAGGTLSGTFQVKTTFLLRDITTGQVVIESPFGPTSETSATLSTQWLRANGIPLSFDTTAEISNKYRIDRRLYRTTTGPGTAFFPWVDVDGNTQTQIQDDLSDAALDNVAAPTTLGNPPGTVGSSRLVLLASWRGRLWGVDSEALDDVVYTEEGSFGQWSNNRFTIPPKGFDSRGVTGFAARREALGVGKTNTLFQITGTNADNFRVVKLSENVGIESPESVVIYRDITWFLWKDGVYQWDNEGIRSVSDGKVRSWFTTDNYFNRSRFQNAFATIDPIRNMYRLHLANAGDSTENRWVEYNFVDKTWWGPHQRDDVTPTSAFLLYDANDVATPCMGNSTGFVWKDQSTRTDGTSTAIDSDLTGKFHDMQTPDIEKYFGELTLISKIQAAGTLTITPYVGGLDASAGTAISAGMTLGRQRLRRLGQGRFVRLAMRHNTAGQDVELIGYEIPFSELGRR